MTLAKISLALSVVVLAGCRDSSTTHAHRDEIENGRQLVAAYGCGSCHQIQGIINARGRVGPTLNGIGRRTLIAGKLVNTPANMRAWLMNPPAVTPGTAMPDLHINESSALAIAAYLATLK